MFKTAEETQCGSPVVATLREVKQNSFSNGAKIKRFLAMTQPFLVNFIDFFDVRLGENLSISWDLKAKTPQNVGLIPSP